MKRRKPKFKPEFVIHSSIYGSFYNNNWRKMHGRPMRRRVHITRERKKQWYRFVDKWNELGTTGEILTANQLRGLLNYAS